MITKKILLHLLILFATAISSLDAATSPTTLTFSEKAFYAPCFLQIKNLYFDGRSSTFFTIEKKLNALTPFELSYERAHRFKRLPYYHLVGQDMIPIKNSILILEKKATPYHSQHYFHFLEHLIGLWNFSAEKIRHSIDLILVESASSNWQGQNAVTYHLLKALFPNATITTWNDFISENKLSNRSVHFENTMISDRSLEKFYEEPFYTERMLGKYFQYLDKASLDHLRSSVWNYCNTKKQPSTKHTVTLIKRKSRKLYPNTEKELIEKINSLSNVHLQIVDFENLSYSEQIHIIANTDLLLGVHGNGFSHILFLPDNAKIIEFFPKNSLRVEYRIFSEIKDLQYYSYVDQYGWINKQEAESLGCHGNIFVEELDIDVDEVFALLKELTSIPVQLDNVSLPQKTF